VVLAAAVDQSSWATAQAASTWLRSALAYAGR